MMPIDPPDLDSRRFADLVEEARQRIPRYAPEWTNLNDSDPGMTLVKLHAWMTETILYELNRVPELNYVAFLNLVGVTPFPAKPARAELTFTLEKLEKPSDPLLVYLPKGVKVAVDDPELDREVAFETDRAATALNAAIAIALAPTVSLDATVTRAVVATFDEKARAATWPYPFAPFGATPAAGAQTILGLMLRPTLSQPASSYGEDVFPSAPLDLYVDMLDVDDRSPDGELLGEAPPYACPVAQGVGVQRGPVEWQIFVGGVDRTDLFDAPRSAGGWVRLETTDDGTLGLTRSGHVVLEIPRAATRISPRALPPAVWSSFGQPKPPATPDELKAAIASPDLAVLGGLEDEHWLRMGVPEERVEDLVACGEDAAAVLKAFEKLSLAPNPAALTAEEWAEIEPLFASPLPLDETGVLRPLYWIRAVRTGDGAPPATIRAIRLNTVPATQATTRLDERLGRSNGRPSQAFALQKTPVLIDPLTGAPDLDLVVLEADEVQDWTRVDSVHDVEGRAEARVYTLDPTTGAVRFDARTPVASAEIVARRYRIGGGAIGNVAAGTITSLKGKIAGVKSVTNTRRAQGGADAETLEAAKARAPRDLRMRERAVTADDFAELARRTRGVAVHKAYALARMVPSERSPSGFQPKDGAVTLVVLTKSDGPKPLPTEAELRAVCAELEPRRLVTTELHVARPRYVEIERLAAQLTVGPAYDLRTVSDAAAAALLRFLDPITGGADETGWPFGEDVYHADLYELLLGVEGVRRVSGLEVSLKGRLRRDVVAGDRIRRGVADDAAVIGDVTRIPEGSLPHLPREALSLEARYA